MVTGTSENQLHWVRGITFAADHSQVRTGSSPRVMMTALCHLATGYPAARWRHQHPPSGYATTHVYPTSLYTRP